MTDALNRSVVFPGGKKSYDFAILVSVGLLAIGLLTAIVANAPELLQDSIQSALLR
jgi:hypothetical protein